MLDYLESMQQRYMLEPGDLKLSSITQLSSAYCLDYARMVEEGDCSEVLIMTYPQKTEITKWVTSVFLVNSFIRDYFDQSQNRIESLGVKPGDYIEIFNTVAKYSGIKGNNRASIKFQASEIEMHPNNFAYINSTKRRKADSIKLYIKNKKKHSRKRQALSRILSLYSGVNPQILTSSALIICGRGNKAKIRSAFTQSECSGEALSKVVLMRDRLTIESDLDCLRYLSESRASDSKLEYFLSSLKYLLESVAIGNETINQRIISILSLLENGDYSKALWNSINELADILITDSEAESQSLNEKLKNVLQYYPERDSAKAERPSAVFINDVEQLIRYKETIRKLLEERIPVIVITDRCIENKSQLGIYQRLFEMPEYENSLRINWNRRKIEYFQNNSEVDEGIDDKKFWDSCCQFENQKIRFKVTTEPDAELAYDIFECSRLVSTFIGYERLQKEYFQSVRPLIYYLKNNILPFQYQDEAFSVLDNFQITFQELKKYFSEHEQKGIEDGINSLKRLIDKGRNSKQFWGSNSVFIQDISMAGELFTIPEIDNVDGGYRRYDEKRHSSITFTGFPYRESNYGFLRDAVFSSIIPEINILTWKLEANITYGYLQRRMYSGYFLDSIPEIWISDEDVLLSSIEECKEEISNVLIFEEAEEIVDEQTVSEDFESIQDIITNFRFSDIQKSSDSEEEDINSYIVKVNVIHLENNRYVLIPYDSKVLVIREQDDGSHQSDYYKFDDIHPGDIFAHTEISKESLKEIVESSSKMVKVVDTLYYWRDILDQYLNTSGNNLSSLIERLNEINKEYGLGGNPSRVNLARWMHDELILAPNSDNLKMILLLEIAPEILLGHVEEIYQARLNIMSLKRQISDKINDRIARVLARNKDFSGGSMEVNLEGIDTIVEVGRIIGLEPRYDLRVEYIHTRKILTD